MTDRLALRPQRAAERTDAEGQATVMRATRVDHDAAKYGGCAALAARSPDEVETRWRIAAIEEREDAVRIDPGQVHHELGLGDLAGLVCESDQSDEPGLNRADEDVDLFSVGCGRARDMAVVAG
jgi:hypothetical protein